MTPFECSRPLSAYRVGKKGAKKKIEKKSSTATEKNEKSYQFISTCGSQK